MLRALMMAGLIALGLTAGTKEAQSNAQTAGAAGATEGISVDLGRRDFRTYCAACHGVSGRGDGTIAEFLTINAADLTRLKKLNAGLFPRERIREVIDGRTEVKVHGPRDMPVWGDWFSDEAVAPKVDSDTREIIVRDRIESLVNYIETLQED
jgi:mono/diheme cytochrome c family protein